jgi:hypothetical protein
MTQMGEETTSGNQPKKSRYTGKQYMIVVAFGGLLLAIWAVAVGLRP